MSAELFGVVLVERAPGTCVQLSPALSVTAVINAVPWPLLLVNPTTRELPAVVELIVQLPVQFCEGQALKWTSEIVVPVPVIVTV